MAYPQRNHKFWHKNPQNGHETYVCPKCGHNLRITPLESKFFCKHCFEYRE